VIIVALTALIALPMVMIEKDYVFGGPNGKRLLQLKLIGTVQDRRSFAGRFSEPRPTHSGSKLQPASRSMHFDGLVERVA
jgi:hypothetical protein